MFFIINNYYNVNIIKIRTRKIFWIINIKIFLKK